ncbi:MAG: hypothetical protein K0S05_3351 [Agromyces sp.]|nr:hypothetical protein [Agromyces sp.]
MRITATFRATTRVPLLQVLKSAVATIAAWLVAGWVVQGQLPVFAAIAALLVVQPSVNQSFGKAVERSIGVILGVLVASGLSLLLGQSTWVILVAIVVAMLVAWALKMTPVTSNQVAISAMLVLALGASSPEYALDRVFETLIGAAIGIIVNALIVPPVAVAPAREQLARLGGELAASVDRLADALERPRTPADLEGLMIEARLLRPMRDAAHGARDRRATAPGGARRAPGRPRRGAGARATRVGDAGADVGARRRTAEVGALDPRRFAHGGPAAHSRGTPRGLTGAGAAAA